jgi:CHRD domain
MARRALAVATTLLLAGALLALGAPGAAAAGHITVLSASLTGGQEVPGPGDPDGSGRAVVALDGGKACFALRWSGIAAPVAAHIHAAPRGVAGDIVVPFFSGEVPAPLSSAAGCVPVDPALAAAIAEHPGRYYVNIHTAEFPGGAIRGQLHRGQGDLDLPGQLVAVLRGANEVPPADPDGRGLALVRVGRTRVCFALAWTGIGPPVASHIHQGPAGVVGDVVVPFFAAPDGLPVTLRAVDGCVGGVDPGLTRDIRRHPSRYYVNVHTAEFPAGAIRGQLHGRQARS